MGELFFIIGLIGGLLGLAIYFGLKRMWFWMGTVIWWGVGLGIGEATSKAITDRTLSQNFWIMSTKNPLEGFTISTVLLLWILLVVVHLLWKNFKDSDYWKRKTRDE